MSAHPSALRPPLWRTQLDEIHGSNRASAFLALEMHLENDAGILPDSPEMLLARVAVGHYTVQGNDGVERQGKPVDITEAAQFKGIELSPQRTQRVDSALATIIPHVVRLWGREGTRNNDIMPADGIRVYFEKSEYQHSYLTKEEEQELFVVSAAGKPLENIENPTETQLQTLRTAQEARNQLVLHNLRFAAKKASQYTWTGYEFDDLVQVANEGLVKAAYNAKPNKGAKFATFAAIEIDAAFKKFFAQGKRGVRIKTGYFETMRFIKAEKDLAEELGRTPTVEELIENDGPKSNLTVSYIMRLRQNAALLNQAPMPETWQEEAHPEEIDPDVYSRSLPAVTHRHIPDDGIFEQVQRELLADEIRKVLDTLSEREVRILQLRFGMNAEENPMTQEQVSEVIGVSSARVGQIERKVLSKLRMPLRAKRLKDFFEE